MTSESDSILQMDGWVDDTEPAVLHLTMQKNNFLHALQTSLPPWSLRIEHSKHRDTNWLMRTTITKWYRKQFAVCLPHLIRWFIYKPRRGTLAFSIRRNYARFNRNKGQLNDKWTHFFVMCLSLTTTGFEQASSKHFVGALLLRCPATTSWNYALHG